MTKRKDKYLLNLEVYKLDPNYIPLEQRVGFNKSCIPLSPLNNKVKLLLYVEASFSSKRRLNKYLKDINKIYQEGISVNIKTL